MGESSDSNTGRTVAYFSIGLSIVVVSATFLYIPYLLNKIALINNQMAMGMEEFSLLEVKFWPIFYIKFEQNRNNYGKT